MVKNVFELLWHSNLLRCMDIRCPLTLLCCLMCIHPAGRVLYSHLAQTFDPLSLTLPRLLQLLNLLLSSDLPEADEVINNKAKMVAERAKQKKGEAR